MSHTQNAPLHHVHSDDKHIQNVFNALRPGFVAGNTTVSGSTIGSQTRSSKCSVPASIKWNGMNSGTLLASSAGALKWRLKRQAPSFCCQPRISSGPKQQAKSPGASTAKAGTKGSPSVLASTHCSSLERALNGIPMQPSGPKGSLIGVLFVVNLCCTSDSTDLRMPFCGNNMKQKKKRGFQVISLFLHVPSSEEPVYYGAEKNCAQYFGADKGFGCNLYYGAGKNSAQCFGAAFFYGLNL